MSLNKYQQKRNFKITSEPSGEEKINSATHIFVVQEHHASHLHYDFRLEIDGVLKSWAIPKGPSLCPKIKRLAVMTEDHPLAYATFAGTIPEGEYGAGKVIIWDHGNWESLDDIQKGLLDGKLTFNLYGKKLRGKWTLLRFKGEIKNWLLIKAHDEFAVENEEDLCKK